MEDGRKSIIKIFCVIREFFLGDRLKRANVYRMYKGYRICSSFFDEELKKLYEESLFFKRILFSLARALLFIKEKATDGDSFGSRGCCK